jgi:preprotein translocase subunit SecE
MARAPEGVTGPAVGKPGRIAPVVERPAPRPLRVPQFRRAPRVLGTTVQFLKDVRAELNRVAWPDRKTVIASSMVVVFVLAVTALYLTAWDWVWAKLFEVLLKP